MEPSSFVNFVTVVLAGWLIAMPSAFIKITLDIRKMLSTLDKRIAILETKINSEKN